MLIVMKFGGSSLATNELLHRAACIAAERAQEGHRVVVVVSARGGTTDELERLARSVTDCPPLRENDVLLSTGEQASMSLMAMELNKLGHKAVSLCGWQAGIHTDDCHGSASVTAVDAERILLELGRGNIVVVAGFQGVNSRKDITTLGRGGSDTTAIALAAALDADACYIYTDVNGVYSADPRSVPDAVLHSEISYDEMMEMSNLGARVLHNRSVSMAKRSGVRFEVRSGATDAAGTTVHALAAAKAVSGIVCDDNISMVTVSGVTDGATGRLFELLAESEVPIDVVIRSRRADEESGTVSFSVSAGECARAVSILHEGDWGNISVEDGLAKLSAVGSGLADSCAVASRMLAVLGSLGIVPKYITTGEIRISVIIPRELSREAQRKLNAEFFGGGS